MWSPLLLCCVSPEPQWSEIVLQISEKSTAELNTHLIRTRIWNICQFIIKDYELCIQLLCTHFTHIQGLNYFSPSPEALVKFLFKKTTVHWPAFVDLTAQNASTKINVRSQHKPVPVIHRNSERSQLQAKPREGEGRGKVGWGGREGSCALKIWWKFCNCLKFGKQQTSGNLCSSTFWVLPMLWSLMQCSRKTVTHLIQPEITNHFSSNSY